MSGARPGRGTGGLGRRRRGRGRSLPALAVCVVVGLLGTACGVAVQPTIPVQLGSSGVPVSVAPNGLSTYTPPPGSGPTGATGATDTTAGPQSCVRSLAPDGTLPTPGDMPTGSTMARIRARGYLMAGVDQDTYRFGYLNPSPGPATGPDAGSDLVVGFDADIVHQIAAAIFGDPGRVRFQLVTKAQRLPAVTSGQVDLVASTLTITCARAQQVAFSAVYLEAGQRVLVNRSSPYTDIGSLRGRPVCAAAGTTSIANIVPYGVIPIAAANETDCLVLLEQGQVDAISTDDTILAGMAAQDPATHLVGPRFTDEPYGVAMSRTAPDLVRFVNGVLQQMTDDGTWAALYNRWIDHDASPTAPVPSYGG